MTIHGICEQARHEPCTVCGAQPEQPCAAGHAPGVHLCRICKAAHDGLITLSDAASVMHDQDVFAGWSLVPDPGAAA